MPVSMQRERDGGVKEPYCSRRLERVFADSFGCSHRTRLVGGAAEPLYQPAASEQGWHQLHYRADYFASALHEVAHWCIAGKRRRGQVDYGYWYHADGRDADQQRAFEAVEFKPQALEWFFSRACGWTFTVSVDNLSSTNQQWDSGPFSARILAQVWDWQATGLPARADVFFRALSAEFGGAVEPRALDFSLAELA
ncbi:MAG: elongation factor P hydroxylase [Halioglobus sp.]